MSVVIVEGPDGAGKTTLIADLAPKLKARVFHNGAFLGERHIGHHYREQLYRALLRPAKSIILDRAWFAEPIYGAAMRGGANRIPAWERRGLERVALRTGAALVLCLPKYDTCRRAWEARVGKGLEYLDRERKLYLVYDRYAKLDPGSLPLQVYDYEKDSPADVLRWLAKQPTPPPVSMAPGLGRFAPGQVTMLVGEEMNARHTLDLPFVSDSRGGSGPWLADRLEEWGVKESELYWVNAFYAGCGQSLSFVQLLRPRRIVALGQVADFRLRELRVEHVAVPHPQFWKRFRHHQEYPLRGALCTTNR